MKQLQICLLVILGSVSFLNAFPNKVIVKNETQKTQMISGEVEVTVTRFATGSNSLKFSIGIAPGQELDLKAFQPSVMGSISKASVSIANKEVNLGNYSAIRIVILQEGDNITTRVESLSMFIAARIAMANWWSKTKSSWSSFWQKLSTRKAN